MKLFRLGLPMLVALSLLMSGCNSSTSILKTEPVPTNNPSVKPSVTVSPVVTASPLNNNNKKVDMKVDLTGMTADEMLKKEKIKYDPDNMIMDKDGNKWFFYDDNTTVDKNYAFKSWYLVTPKGLVGKLSYPSYFLNNQIVYSQLLETRTEIKNQFIVSEMLGFQNPSDWGSEFFFSRELSFLYNQDAGVFEINKSKSTCDQSIFEFNIKRDFSYELGLLRGFANVRLRKYLANLGVNELSKEEKKSYSQLTIFDSNDNMFKEGYSGGGDERVEGKKVYVKDRLLAADKDKVIKDLLGLSKFFVNSLKIKGSRLIANVSRDFLGLTFDSGSYGGGETTEMFVHTLLSNYPVKEVQVIVNGNPNFEGNHFNFDTIFKQNQNHDNYFCPNAPKPKQN